MKSNRKPAKIRLPRTSPAKGTGKIKDSMNNLIDLVKIWKSLRPAKEED